MLEAASKIEKKLEKRGGSLEKKPLWMKCHTFKKLEDKHYDYREIKYEKACMKELAKYCPGYFNPDEWID